MFEEKIIWHEIKMRPTTPEEKKSYLEVLGYEPEELFDCETPQEGDRILIATKNRVDTDICLVRFINGDEILSLVHRDNWDGIIAWAAMPKYKGSELEQCGN